MENNQSNTVSKVYRKLMEDLVESEDFSNLRRCLINKIKSAPATMQFSPDEVKIIQTLISWSPARLELNELMRQKMNEKIKVKEILLSKNPDEKKIRLALEVCGYSIKKSKQELAQKAVDIYKWLIKSQPGTNSDGRSEMGWYHIDKPITISWKTDREKKIEIIKLIRLVVYSDAITMTSVMKGLSRKGISDLPTSYKQ
jgi:hypothetical protein